MINKKKIKLFLKNNKKPNYLKLINYILIKKTHKNIKKHKYKNKTYRKKIHKY